MAITQANAMNEILHAHKQRIIMARTASQTIVAGQPSTLISVAGNPAAGSLNPGNTTTGIVPIDSDAGYPNLDTFGVGKTGYLASVEFASTVQGSVAIYDVLFAAGQTTIPTSGTTTVTLGSQPSFASRVPFKSDGVTRDYRQVDLFLQASVAWSNHAHSTAVTYLDEGGNSSSTGNVSTQNIIVNRWIRCRLAAGDEGVSQISSYAVNGIASAAGAVSVICARLLFIARGIANSAFYGPDQTGLPQVFDTSALLVVPLADGGASGLPSVRLTIAEV
jgi:hypothetical protein